jgi:hypothetical protein
MHRPCLRSDCDCVWYPAINQPTRSRTKEEGLKVIQKLKWQPLGGAGWDVAKTVPHRFNAARTRAGSRGELRRGRAEHSKAHNQLNGNPLVDVRTGARHADGRLGGLWNRHCLEEKKRGSWSRWFYSKLNKNKPNKTYGKYIFMENIFHQQRSNSHPEGMCHCFKAKAVNEVELGRGKHAHIN